jgi:hypothetical protein
VAEGVISACVCEQRPVCATIGLIDVWVVVDSKEDQGLVRQLQRLCLLMCIFCTCNAYVRRTGLNRVLNVLHMKRHACKAMALTAMKK